MLKILGIDWETSIGTGVHGSDPKDPSNDIYTVIAGDRPDNVHVKHFPNGCNRITGIDYTKYDLLVAHNASFDIAYIWNDPKFQEFLQKGGKIWCTAQAEYFLSAQRHNYPALAELQLKYLKEKTKESRISKLFDKGIDGGKIIAAKHTHKRLWALYNKYAKDDVVSMLKIFSLQYRAVKAAGMLNIITMHQKALLAVITMHTNGMKLDLIRCENTLRDFKIKSMKYLKEATDLVSPLWDERLGEFNINSPKDKSAMLFGGTFKVKVRKEDGLYKNGNVKYTTVQESVHIKGFGLPKDLSKEGKIEGQFSTGEKVINNLARKAPNATALKYARLQQKAMQYSKMCSTYLQQFLKFNVDGILYPTFNTTTTISGRLSGKKPNMQNIPASGDMSDAIQSCLVAPEGWICLSIDFSQLEPFVTALISGDKKLTQDLVSGVCLHCRAVSWIPRLSEGKTYDEIYQLAVVEKHPDWVLKRKKAKGVNFKRAYGGGAKSLAEAEDLDIEDVKAVFAGQEEEYHEHARFLKSIYDNLGRTERVSRAIDYATTDRKGMKFNNGLELLPIFERGNTDAQYRADEYRKYDVYTEMTGRKYSFLQTGQIDKWGRLHKRYSTTETRNYFIQGTAADVMQMASCELFDYCLKNKDVKLVRQIHDEAGFYVKKDTASVHIPKICAIMSSTREHFKKYLGMNIPFDFRVEAKVGTNFANLEIWDERQ